MFYIKVVPQIAYIVTGKSIVAAFFTVVRIWGFAVVNIFFKNTFLPIKMRDEKGYITVYIQTAMDLVSVAEVYKELCVEKQYEWDLDLNIKKIIDLGAHFGDTSLWYSLRFPDADIIAVEPFPQNVRKIEKAIKDNNRISVIEAAITKKSGPLKFYITPSTLGASTVKREKAKDEVMVRGITLYELFDEVNIDTRVDLIKFDIEGSEFDIFMNIEPSKYSRAFIGELHFDLVEGVTVQDFCDKFSAFDYSLEKLDSAKVSGTRYMFKAVLKS